MSKQQQQQHTIILGVDPGTRITGYGIIKTDHSSYSPIDYGCIRPPVNLKLSDRYLIIFNSVEELIRLHSPHVVVVETQYVHRNVQSAMKLGMARGMIILAAKRRGLPVVEYAPTQAKRAVVGNGAASKSQVQGMVQRLLNLTCIPEPEDAADALALAMCHAHASRSLRPFGTEI